MELKLEEKEGVGSDKEIERVLQLMLELETQLEMDQPLWGND